MSAEVRRIRDRRSYAERQADYAVEELDSAIRELDELGKLEAVRDADPTNALGVARAYVKSARSMLRP